MFNLKMLSLKAVSDPNTISEEHLMFNRNKQSLDYFYLLIKPGPYVRQLLVCNNYYYFNSLYCKKIQVGRFIRTANVIVNTSLK